VVGFDPLLGQRQPVLPNPLAEAEPRRRNVGAGVEGIDEFGPSDLCLAAGPEAAVPLLAASSPGTPTHVEDDVPADALPSVPAGVDALMDVALHLLVPAQPGEQRGDRHEQPAAQSPGRELTPPGRLVCRCAADSQHLRCLGDGDRGSTV
jgi:hypothetical protein